MLWLKRLFLPLLLAAPLYATLVLGIKAQIESVALVWLSAALFMVCAAIAALALIGARLPAGTLLQGIAGLLYGCFFAVHFREVTAFPPNTIGLVVLAVLIGLLTTVVLRLLAGRRHREPPISRAEQTMPQPVTIGWRWLASTLLLALLLPIGLYLAGGSLRWHLLQHTKVLGSPVQLLLGKTPAKIEAEALALRGLSGAKAAAEIANRFAPGATPFTADSAAPSIVFVMIDTLRADSLQTFGGQVSAMPRLDRVFRQCQKLTDVLANSSWTRPSIASMHTGLLPEHHGARGVRDPLEPSHTTFVEILQRAGYETVALVTNPTAGVASGLNQGFDRFLEIERTPYARAETLDKATLDLLDRRAREEGEQARPLFLYLHYLDPHEPYLAGTEPNGWGASSYRAAYNAELTYLDDQLDRVLPEIRSRLGTDTIFFFVSDHGEEFFEHELFGHGHSLYREVVGIPAALCGGPFAGGKIDARLEGRDVFSLMLGLANGTLSSNIDLLRWSQSHQRSTRYLSLSFQGFGRLQLRPYLQSIYQRALETKEGKWIWNAYGQTWEFYAANDPDEVRNLAGRGTEPPVEELRAQTPDPWYRAHPITVEDSEQGRLNSLGYVQ